MESSVNCRLLPLVWLLALFLFVNKEVGVNADGDEDPNSLGGGLASSCGDDETSCKPPQQPTSSSATLRPIVRYPEPTERPKKKNSPTDPDKYGLVPPFLIGASSVIIVYIVSHCLYLHCYAKKKIRNLSEQSNQQTNQTTLVVSDGPSTASLAVRYDGAYGKTEIINATPYLLCHNNPSGMVAMFADQQTGQHQQHEMNPVATAGTNNTRSSNGFMSKFRRGVGGSSSAPVPTSANVNVRLSSISSDQQSDGTNPDGAASPRPSVCSGDSTGTFSRGAPAEVDPATGERSGLCFVPVGRAMSDQKCVRPEWTPIQGIMYNAGGPHAGGILKRDSSHTLVFVPVGNSQSMNSDQPNGIMAKRFSGPDGTIYFPLEGNASNMAVPSIVEDQASDSGSRESSTIEHEALIHDDVTMVTTRVGEHSV